MAIAEGGIIEAPKWGDVWGGIFPPQPTRGSGDRPELPQWDPEHSPGRKRILKATTFSLDLYADALSSSKSVSCHIWGKAVARGSQLPPPLPNVETTPGCQPAMTSLIGDAYPFLATLHGWMPQFLQTGLYDWHFTKYGEFTHTVSIANINM